MNSVRADAGVIWVDLTKFGRLQNDDMNNVVDVVRNLLTHSPKTMCAIIVVPILWSAKVVNGIRGEVRPSILK